MPLVYEANYKDNNDSEQALTNVYKKSPVKSYLNKIM